MSTSRKPQLARPEDCDCYQSGDQQCRCCGASLKMPVHSLSRGLAETLDLLAKGAIDQGGYIVDMGLLKLSHNQLCNAQKLRYFGLMVKYEIDGAHVPRTWIITSLGWSFLRGEAQVQKKRRSFHNQIVHWTEQEAREIPLVTVHDLLGTDGQRWPAADYYRDNQETATPQLGLNFKGV